MNTYTIIKHSVKAYRIYREMCDENTKLGRGCSHCGDGLGEYTSKCPGCGENGMSTRKPISEAAQVRRISSALCGKA